MARGTSRSEQLLWGAKEGLACARSLERTTDSRDIEDYQSKRESRDDLAQQERDLSRCSRASEDDVGCVCERKESQLVSHRPSCALLLTSRHSHPLNCAT